MVSKVIYVGMGGALGALLRYFFIVVFPSTPGSFPLTIFVENITGSFLLGLLLIMAVNKWKSNGPQIAFFGTGLLGSFTTFSNFSMDMVTLVHEGAVFTALLYMMLSILAGLTSALAGMMLGRKIGRHS